MFFLHSCVFKGSFANRADFSSIVATYITGVDKPGNIPKGSQFSIHKAAHFTVFPAVVDVNYSHHVPLEQRQEKARFYL